jgi:hypothetical protein
MLSKMTYNNSDFRANFDNGSGGVGAPKGKNTNVLIFCRDYLVTLTPLWSNKGAESVMQYLL